MRSTQCDNVFDIVVQKKKKSSWSGNFLCFMRNVEMHNERFPVKMPQFKVAFVSVAQLFFFLHVIYTGSNHYRCNGGV